MVTEVFSLRERCWMRLLNNAMAEPYSHHRLIHLDGRLMHIGGRSENVLGCCFQMKLDFFPHRTPGRRLSELAKNGRWDSIADLRKKRHSFGVATAYGRAIVVGGSNDARVLDSIEVYNPKKNVWRISNHRLLYGRQNLTLLIWKSQNLVVLGGVDINGVSGV